MSRKTFTDSITDVQGIKVGHAQNDHALTGCTVILCEKGGVGGVDQRGGAPGTRETDLLRPLHMVNQVHAILLAGGSAYGLDAASGVMRFLEENKIGFDTGAVRVPIVPSAILYDLDIGDPFTRPNADMGYQACINASNQKPLQGNIGAGTGASVGKIFGIHQAVKSGIGTASVVLGAGLIVGAIIAVNSFGDIRDPQTNQIIAGARSFEKGPLKIGSGVIYANTLDVMKSFAGKTILKYASQRNTVIGVVATNARLSKEEANKVAQMAHNGLANTIYPTHTMLDGDTLFCIATGQKRTNVNLVGAYSSVVVARAIINAVLSAKPAGSLPSAHSLILHNSGSPES